MTDNNIKSHLSASDWIQLVLLSILWGGSFFFTEIALRELPTFTIVAIRVALAAALLWLWLIMRGQRIRLTAQALLVFVVMGTLNNAIPFTLIVWGQTGIASSMAAIINATTPIFTLLVAHALLPDEKLTAKRLLAVAIGLGGVVIMMTPALLSGASSTLTGQLAVMGAAISYAFAMTIGRRFKRLGLNPVVASAGQLTAATVLLVPLALAVDGPPALGNVGWDVLISVVLLAALSTALAYLLFFNILASAGANNVSLVTLLIPVSAGLLGVFVLGEKFTLWQMIGMICIAIAMALISGRSRR